MAFACRSRLALLLRRLAFASAYLSVFYGVFYAEAHADESSAVKPSWIQHNAIAPLLADASDEQLRFLPIFVFTHGTCLASAAIDADGRLGGGLKASGDMDGKCPGYDQANIYAQTLEFGAQRVHIYALYYPKDGSQPNSAGGHRHDWEHVLVWTEEARITAVTFSQHGGYYTLPAPQIRIEDEHPLVFVGKAKHGMYHSPNNGPGGLIEGLCYFCDTRSDPGLRWFAPHRLLDFERMSERQQQLLQSNIWGKANSPFRADVFAVRAADIVKGEVCSDMGCKCDTQSGSCPGFP